MHAEPVSNACLLAAEVYITFTYGITIGVTRIYSPTDPASWTPVHIWLGGLAPLVRVCVWLW